jgi:hypothetical protein
MTNTINIFKSDGDYAFSILPHDSNIKFAKSIDEVVTLLAPEIQRMLVPGLKIVVNFPPDSCLIILMNKYGKVNFVSRQSLSHTEQEELERKLMKYDFSNRG